MTKENNVIYGPVGTASISESTAGKQLYDVLQRHSHLPQAMVSQYFKFYFLFKLKRRPKAM